VVFGGLSVQNGSTLIYTNTCMIYDATANVWEAMPVAQTLAGGGPTLEPRAGHSAIKFNDTHMLVHGGNGFFTIFDTTYMFNVATREWTWVNTTVFPISKENTLYENITLTGADNGTHITPTFYPRTGHKTEVLYDRKAERPLMFMFGGRTITPTEVFLNELWILDLVDFTWYLVPSPNPPSPRAYYGSVLVDAQSFLVWGGINGSDIVQGDIFVYTYNDGFNVTEAPEVPKIDTIANYGVAGAAAGILVVLVIIVVIVKCSEKKI
jgi:hypothetical protein